jgi:protein-S-isoprenylcysteine O-methyltransferase Ste14
MSYEIYSYIVFGWTAVGVITFFYLLKTTAPYGRHTKTNWGPLIDNKLGWFIMEFPVLLFLFWFLKDSFSNLNQVAYVIIGLFILHYLNRSIIFPLRIKTKGKKMPLIIALSAIGFNFMNGFQLGYYFANFAEYTNLWFSDVRFIIGIIVFFTGVGINVWSDEKLMSLRKPGETGYKIPHGGLFNYISCPNLLGEVLEWLGFAILSWSLPGVSFFVWTCANLIPRAISHHKWYKEKFADYPSSRNAIIPGIV